MFRIRYFSPIGKDSECFNTEVYTNCFVLANWLHRHIGFIHFHKNWNEILACRSSWNSRRFHYTFKCTMKLSLDTTLELWNEYATIFKIYPCVLRYRETLLAIFLRLESWETFVFSKELSIGWIKIGKWGLKWKRINLFQPTILFWLLHLRQVRLNIETRKISFIDLIRSHFLVKSIVIDETTRTKMLCYKHLLLLVRI